MLIILLLLKLPVKDLSKNLMHFKFFHIKLRIDWVSYSRKMVYNFASIARFKKSFFDIRY